MLVGVVSDGADTGLAVETRSWSSSAVPFPHEDLKHMVSDGGWPWGWVGGVDGGWVGTQEGESAGRGEPGDSR